MVVAPPEPAAPARADRRRAIYAGVDLAMAGVAVLLALVAPTRHLGGQLLLWGIVLAYGVAGASSLVGRRIGLRAATAALAALLVIEVAFLVLLVSSASYLAGVFGAFGRGAAAICLVAAALSIQLVALVPALQLKYLRTRAGRRAFGVAAS
jgi:hypothetical protein